MEKDIHKSICQYLRMQYPNLLFTTSLDGIKLTIGQATKLKSLRSCRGWPDIMIFKPMNGKYGLFLEVKNGYSSVYKKNGELLAGDHLHEQFNMIKRLIGEGYEAYFTFDFDHAKYLIDRYLKDYGCQSNKK